MEGWVKLHRKLLDWEWYQNSEMVHVFIHLLISANHEPGRWQGIDIKRGQFISSRDKLALATGISHQTIRTCLERLKSTNQVTSEPTSKYTLYTIVNYEEYQCKENESTNQQNENQPATNQQSTSNQPATNQQLTTNKNENNENNEENKKNILTHDKTPFAEMLENWNGILGGKLPKIKELSEARKRLMRQRWNNLGGELGYWEDFCHRIAASQFLMGMSGTNWRADFDWCMKTANFIKIKEGNYDNRGKTNSGTTAERDQAYVESIDRITAIAEALIRDKNS